MHKIRTNYQDFHSKPFAYMALFLALGVSMLYPIFPNFVKDILKEDSNVSFFFAAMGVVSLMSGLTSALLFKKVTRISVTKISLLLLGLVFFSFIFINRVYELAVINSFKVWLELLLLTTLGLFVRDYANMANLGREEGFYYRYQNIGYLLGPLIGGFLAVNFQYEFVFIISAAIMFFTLAYFFYQESIKEHPALVHKKTENPNELIKNLKDFISNSNYRKAYLITMFSMIWVAFKRVYIPLYVVSSGYLETVSGLLIGLAIIPYILLEVKVGEYADKHDVKIPVRTGLIVMASLLLITFFSPFPLINFCILLLINFGGAMLEPLGDYYLLKEMPKEKEENFYGIYRSADTTAVFLTMIFGGVILSFFDFKFLFLFFSVTMFIAAYWAHKKLTHR
ncbi:hypothetical protein COU74_05070 [Candidatus Peregrinibacteria bacterium CG10_big_fil_rev_8_21_14_0_10_36_19]|nr:MAG: hypothetical protein COU74_05070 [Candidatus Peregrinibacteria bacterium CG10_big_fil_rev_8_21_14_0_10_36_19]